MRAQNYDLVHTHAPVASVLGRVAGSYVALTILIAAVAATLS